MNPFAALGSQLNLRTDSSPMSQSWQHRLTPVARLLLRRVLGPPACFPWALDQFLQSHIALPLDKLLPPSPPPQSLPPPLASVGRVIASLLWAMKRASHETPVLVIGGVVGAHHDISEGCAHETVTCVPALYVRPHSATCGRVGVT